GSITYTVALADADGNAVTTNNPIEVALANGEILTIGAGNSQASLTIDAPDDDIYVDAEAIANRIVSASEDVAAGTPGSLEDLAFDATEVTTQVADTLDPVTVSLTATENAVEGGSITYTATLTDADGNPVTANNAIEVTLANGEIITIGAGSSEESITIDAPGDDIFIDAGDVTNSIVGASEGVTIGTPGSLEDLAFDNTEVTTQVADTIDTVTVWLTATESVDEGGSITYTASLTDADGTPVTANNAIAVTLDTGETITILAGSSDGTLDIAAPEDNVYLDAGEVERSIDSVQEIDTDGDPVSAGAAGSLEDLQFDATPVTTDITDTIDTVTVNLSAPTEADEGGIATVTLSVSDAPQGGPLTIELSDGTSVEIPEDQTSIEVDLAVPNQNQDLGAGEAGESTSGWTIGIDSVSGGNYENVVPGDDATVTVNEDVPGLQVPDANGADNGDVSVFEAGLDDGSNPGDSKSVDGTFTISAGNVDELESLTIGSDSFSLADLQGASDASPLTVGMTYGGLDITGYDAGTGEVSYTYTLTANADHASGDVLDSVDITVTDTSGDRRADSLDVNIVDDVPSASDDTPVTVTEGDSATTGNVLENDTQGADGAYVSQITYSDRNGDEAQADITEGGSVSVETLHGELTVESDGDWSYTPLDSADHSASGDDVSASDNFSYVLTDGDGDESEPATQPIEVEDTEPEVGTPPDASVNERNLANGTDPDPTALTQTGTLAVTAGQDSLDTTLDEANVAALESLGLTSGEQELDFTLSADGYTLTATADSETVFTLVITDPGSDNPGYSFTLESALDHVTGVTNAAGDIITLPFDFTVTDSDNDTASGSFNVDVVDNTPVEASINATVDEDTSLEVPTPANATPDTIIIDPEPEYGSVTIAPDGTLTFTPNENYSGQDTFTYSYTEGGETRSVTVNLTINPVADAPQLPESADVETLEDEAVALGLNAPSVTDNEDQNGAEPGDNPELLGAISLSGIPDGAELLDDNGDTLLASDGSPITIALSDGSHIADAEADADLVMTTAQYQALQILPAQHDADNFTIDVSVTSFEVDDSGNPLDGVTGATASTSVNVGVQAVTDDVELLFDTGQTSIDGVTSVSYDSGTQASLTIAEDSRFDLRDLLSAQFEDLDGSEVRSITIENPTGNDALVINDSLTLAGGGSLTIDALDGQDGQTGGIDSFPEIRFGAALNFSGDLTGITITLNAQDVDADGFGGNDGPLDGVPEADTSNNSVQFDLFVTPVAGDIGFSAIPPTEEDTAVDFLSGLSVIDTRASSEVIDSVAFEIPTGWDVNQATVNTAGWSVSGDGSAGDPYTITFDGSLTQTEREEVLSDFTITPAPHSSENQDIELTITTTDTNTVDGTQLSDTQQTTSTLPVRVTPVAEVVGGDSDGDGSPDLTINGDHTYGTEVDGVEDQWFALNADGFDFKGPWNNQDGIENGGTEQTFALLTPQLVDSLSDVLNNNANGASFRYSTNGDTSEAGGDWVVKTFNGSPVEVPIEFLDTVQFRAAPNQKGQFEITVQAKTVDTDPDTAEEVSAISGSATLDGIFIDQPVADLASLSVTTPAEGNEDEEITLGIRPQSEDPNESFQVTIGNVPVGAVLRYDGSEVVANGDGDYVIDDFDSSRDLTIQPPLDSNEDFTLTASVVTVDEYDGETDTLATPIEKNINVLVDGVADAPDIVIATPVYSEADLDDGTDSVMLSDILTTAESTDIDGSETLTYRITGLDEQFDIEDATLIRGEGAEREWVANNLATTQVTAPENFSGRVEFDVTTVVTENDGDSQETTNSVAFEVTPSPEAAFSIQSDIIEDTLGQVDLALDFQNGDTDETLDTVWISPPSLADGDEFTLFFGSDGATTLAEAAADAGNGDVTLVGDQYQLTNGAWENIYAKGSANFSGNAGQLEVGYTVTDTPNAGYEGEGADTVADVTSERQDATHTIFIDAVTDAPSVTITGITSGDGSAVIAGNDVTADGGDSLEVTVEVTQQNDTDANGEADTDGSEQLKYFVIDNVPAGVSVAGGEFVGQVAGGTGSQWRVEIDPDRAFDTQTLTETFTFVLSTDAQVNDIQAQQITITGVTQDDNVIGGVNAGEEERDSDSWTLTGTGGEGDGGELPAEINTWEYSGAAMDEDVGLSLAELVNADIGEPAAGGGRSAVTISNLPDGAVVNGMSQTTIDGETVWYASIEDPSSAALQTLLEGIEVIPPPDTNDNTGSFSFDTTLTTQAPNGRQNVEQITLTPTVTPVTDTPTVTVTADDVASGDDVDFSIDISSPADAPNVTLENDQVVLTLDESDMIAGDGATVGGILLDSEGNAITPQGDGTYLLEGVAIGDSLNVTYRPAENTWGDVSLNAEATTQEAGAANSATGSGSATPEIAPPLPEVSLSNSSGNEDELIELQGLEVSLPDSSLTLNAVLIDNVPDGWLVRTGTDADNTSLAENIGGNSWSIPVDSNGDIPDFVGLQPPRNWSGTLEGEDGIRITAQTTRAGERSTTSEPVDITVAPVADGITLDPELSFGREGEKVPLNLSAAMTDLDGSETATISLTGIGANASFFTDGGDTLLQEASESYDPDNDTYTLEGLTPTQVNDLYLVQAATDGAQTVSYEAFTTDVAGALSDEQAPPDTGSFSIDIEAVEPTTGDDTLLYTGEPLDGLAGVDVVELRFNEDPNPDDLSNIEILDLMPEGEDHSVALTAEDVLDMTDDDNVLSILGDAGDSVDLSGSSWTAGGTENDGGVTYQLYNATVGGEEATLRVQQDVPVDI
ncbi:hypothetical protein C1H70_08195, partial [Halomonas urumqiensis]